MSRHLRLADDAGIIEQADEFQLSPVTYLAKLPQGPILSLAGSAQVIWVEAVAGPLDDLAERVAARFGMPTAEIVADVQGFVAELVRAQVVTIIGDDGSAA
ncbi:MAG: PqqD family protein [Tetrasphaera sp.]